MVWTLNQSVYQLSCGDTVSLDKHVKLVPGSVSFP